MSDSIPPPSDKDKTILKGGPTKPGLAKKSRTQARQNKNIKTSIPKAEQMEAIIKKKHDKTDEELLEAIKVRPENAHKKTHLLDREQQEARMVLMHRLMIRKVAPKDIQAQLGITTAMYYQLKPKLDAQLRLDISKLDVPYMIGDSLALYDEVRSMALMMSSANSIKDPRIKLQAMNVVLKAEADKNAFLAQCGVYAPQIVEHLIRGMVSTGATLLLSGEKRDRTKSVEDMVTELLDSLHSGNPEGTRPSFDDPFEMEDAHEVVPRPPDLDDDLEEGPSAQSIARGAAEEE